MKPSIRFVKREDGVKIAYSMFGKGPPMIYPAPWVTNQAFFHDDPALAEFWGRLARKMTVVLYDKHGCGQSDRDRTEFTPEADLLELETVIDHLGLEKVVLLGVSAGGPLSIMYATRHPEKVTHLVLYGTFASGKNAVKDEVLSGLISIIRSTWGLGSRVLADIFVPGATKEIQEIYARFQREACSPEMAAKLLEHAFAYDVTNLLRRITVPTLILHRRGEKAIPVEQGRQLGMGIPNARFEVLDGDLHFPWLGDSAIVIEEIFEFLGMRETIDQGYEEDLPAEESEVIEQATIVFTDIASSTDIVSQVGDAAARDILLKHDNIVRDQVRIHGGRELQNLGDGFMLSFDSASLAIKCGCAIQKAMAENLPSIQIRIGINTGEVIRREGDHPFGQAVIIASRIVSKSKGGQILVSDVTRVLAAGGNFTFTESGRFKPKGFRETVKLYEVSWKESYSSNAEGL